MIAGYLSVSVLVSGLALGLSVLAGHPPLAWLLFYAGAGATSLMALVFLRAGRWEEEPDASGA
ncbi:hypothetical protein [Paracoccus sp. IB05]|uniref:hypothetical protein n=1 Tax=Paracoccus sp. IB05 TaxID=2779367 RepID=UPI0018E6FEC6|nr:hypothetical protein [Paracoccus sp. IB05]MBJ2152329.1 hypothetical protein [Paracoccus sp. IB05]